jgi:phytol kinase
MDSQLKSSIIFLGSFLLLVILTQLLYTFLDLQSRTSRKFIHVMGGVLALTIPLFIQSHWYVLVLCIFSLSLLAVTYFKKQLPSIHLVSRVSVGSILFPLPVYICFLVASKSHNMLLYYLPVSLLTFADAMAEVGGSKWGHNSISLFNKQKTLLGSLCFGVTALILSIIFVAVIFKVQLPRSVILILLITFTTTAAEMITFRGYDNLSVPLSALFILRLFL